jgi:hypothetical protein
MPTENNNVRVSNFILNQVSTLDRRDVASNKYYMHTIFPICKGKQFSFADELLYYLVLRFYFLIL